MNLSRKFFVFGLIIALVTFMSACDQGAAPTDFELQGNGAPSGEHYTLNIIGVPKNKTADMTSNNGHRIFVPLYGKVAINLTEGEFGVLDANGTDKDGALFALPDPDVDGDGVLDGDYSVWVRPLGQPGGLASITTCAELIAELGTVLNRKSDILDHEDAYCSIDEEMVMLERGKGKSTFQNVTNQLLTIVFEVEITDEDGNVIGTELIRIPLFDDRIDGEFWEYDNSGLRLAQLRFYPIN